MPLRLGPVSVAHRHRGRRRRHADGREAMGRPAPAASALSGRQPAFIAWATSWVKTPEPGRFMPPSTTTRVPVT